MITSEEIDEWFNQKKENLFERYYQSLEKGRKIKKVDEKEYQRLSLELRKEYERKLEDMQKSLLRRKKMATKWKPLLNFKNKLKSYWESLVELYK